jgi:hypothetical protein
MRRLRIDLDQFMEYLEEMRASGTQTIYLYEQNELPAICDVEDESNYLIFSFGTEEDDGLH